LAFVSVVLLVLLCVVVVLVETVDRVRRLEVGQTAAAVAACLVLAPVLLWMDAVLAAVPDPEEKTKASRASAAMRLFLVQVQL